MNTLRDLYLEELKDLYSAETQLIKALPRMAKAASHPQLARAFTTHLRQTERQAKRLEQIFRMLGESPRGKKCIGMEALIEEGKELMREKPDPDVLDAGLIAKAQHVEHYEIAGYGTVRTYAQQLGEDRQAQLLQETLDEEGQTDKLLTELAESAINLEAAGDGAGVRSVTRRNAFRAGRLGRSAEREVTRRPVMENGRTTRRGGGGRSRARREQRASA
jgi:ferritin-like metal-binding protein YciE